MQPKLRIDGTIFRDEKNREVTLHGINLAGDAKYPATPDQPSHVSDNFLDGDNVSFVGRPFSLEDAPVHFRRLRNWGYNTLRYIFTWEAIEHAGPGKYDEDFIRFTIEVLRLAKKFGFYINMDPHQDVVSYSFLCSMYCCYVSNHDTSGRASQAAPAPLSGPSTPAASIPQSSTPPNPPWSKTPTKTRSPSPR